MEKYKSTIATNDKVELVMASLDDDKKAAVSFAKSAGFPWPTVLKNKISSVGFDKFMPRGIPGYVLIDKEGKHLATGSSACFAKIKELAPAKAEAK